MDGGTTMVIGQLFGGLVATLAVVGGVAVCAFLWAFRRLWMLVKLELLIEGRRRQLNELSVECDVLEAKKRSLLRGMPLEVPNVVQMSKSAAPSAR